jgi:hypothetical protein
MTSLSHRRSDDSHAQLQTNQTRQYFIIILYYIIMTATTRRDGFVRQRKPIIPTTIDTYKYDTVRYTILMVILYICSYTTSLLR